MTLTEFLLARIAEDEAVAKAATPGPWVGSLPAEHICADHPRIKHAARTVASADMRWGDGADNAAHVARHDPAYVLADCEAKRAVVVMVDGALAMGGDLFTPFRLILNSLALPFADHPDYREEWKP